MNNIVAMLQKKDDQEIPIEPKTTFIPMKIGEIEIKKEELKISHIQREYEDIQLNKSQRRININKQLSKLLERVQVINEEVQEQRKFQPVAREEKAEKKGVAQCSNLESSEDVIKGIDDIMMQ